LIQSVELTKPPMLSTNIILNSVMTLVEGLESSQIDAIIRELEMLSDNKFTQEQLNNNSND
jgi:hypothetical protein